VPTDKLEAAASILHAPQNTTYYTVSEARPGIDPESLMHTFRRFKCNGILLWFELTPAIDCHIECVIENLERSMSGIPYPKLSVYVQSLLDTHNANDLADMIDGMDLSAEWGEANLELEGTSDVTWVTEKNERIRASMPDKEETWWLFEIWGEAFPRREFRETSVSRKEHRLGIKYPKDLNATRFRTHG
jgi:hypothetical protein